MRRAQPGPNIPSRHDWGWVRLTPLPEWAVNPQPVWGRQVVCETWAQRAARQSVMRCREEQQQGEGQERLAAAAGAARCAVWQMP